MSLTRKRLVIALVAAGVVAAASIGAFRVHAVADPAAGAAPQATPVDVAAVVHRGIVDWQDYSGRLEAVDHVAIRPQVSGTITEVHFRDGSLVDAGAPLFTIDPRPYAAAVERAEARVAAAEARAAYTASELERSKRLIADNAIARRDHDQRVNAAREATAELQAARAERTAARLDLSHTRITAPVAGRVSRAEVTVGNLVSAGTGSAPLTTLVSVASLYASFEVDEQSYLRHIHGALVRERRIPVLLGLADETGYPRVGIVDSVDNRLDPASGTIRVRAVFDNADGMLVPGLYARVRLGGAEERVATLVDERAIGTDQNKRFVLVVDAEGVVHYREVQPGPIIDGLRVIESGLEEGERIVVNGLHRVRPGAVVAPQDVPMAGSAAAPAEPVPPAAKPATTPVAGSDDGRIRT
ncbi:MAG: efflux RND transporter periplasmic adaptor subunit [Zoogloeaceae bacterium]|nr:efflux RND transporter periplasmic adaptor subunit [Zoogloeaceae bacterium]